MLLTVAICRTTVAIVQSFSAKHQQQVVELITQIQQQEFGIAITIADQPDLLNIPEFYQVDNGNFWVALDPENNREQVIGTIALIDIGNHQAVIRKMFVHQNYRGKQKGIGQQLLQTLIDWAKYRSITELYLGTTEKLKASHRFYEKNGFVQIEKFQLPKTFPIMNVDTRFYQYWI
ncbi:MAG TPA: GNAT family N-acetyltransferase [Coleofasciculaceae cyanobacterium]